jgi:hypothetical protein
MRHQKRQNINGFPQQLRSIVTRAGLCQRSVSKDAHPSAALELVANNGLRRIEAGRNPDRTSSPDPRNPIAGVVLFSVKPGSRAKNRDG